MARDKADPKARIVEAAIEAIEAEGLEGVTVRSIAARAKANIAAIGYHFGSKDELLDLALATAWENAAGDLREFLASEPWDPRGGLERMLEFLCAGAIAWPNLTRAHLFSERAGSRVARAEMAAFFTKAAERSVAALGAGAVARLDDRVAAFLAASVFPTLARVFFREAFGLDLGDASARSRYISAIVEEFLAGLRAG